MQQTRKEIINKFVNEGFTHRTLSLFSNKQLLELNKKIFKEAVSSEDAKKAQSTLIQKKEEELAYLKQGLDETDETEEELDIETDGTGNPDVDIDGTPLLREKEIEEKFASKAQQNYLYAVNPAAAEKLGSKMTKKDYEELPDTIDEGRVLQEWVMSIVENNQHAEITKASFIKTIKENISKNLNESSNLGTEEQTDSFNTVVEIGEEMDPSMSVQVDGFDDDGHLMGFLKGQDTTNIIDLNICPAGDIKLDGITVGEMNLSETERDEEGEYIGAPEATTAPAPLKTPTIAPSKPGEKKRRGPFERPKTTPKPKAKNKNSLPDWLTSTNLGKSLTQHG
tara:strand:+ start:2602 stop:3615 length:1014 start_codon:yes stop_codon:yes gene_type:complete